MRLEPVQPLLSIRRRALLTDLAFGSGLPLLSPIDPNRLGVRLFPGVGPQAGRKLASARGSAPMPGAVIGIVRWVAFISMNDAWYLTPPKGLLKPLACSSRFGIRRTLRFN